MLGRSWRAGDEDDLAEPPEDGEEDDVLDEDDDVLDEDDAGVPDGLPPDVEGPEAD